MDDDSFPDCDSDRLSGVARPERRGALANGVSARRYLHRRRSVRRNTPKRPSLILSNDHVPFHGEAYVAAVITTTARTDSVELTADRLERGRLPRTSYVSPWSVFTLKDWMITKQPAQASAKTVDEVRQELDGYLQTD